MIHRCVLCHVGGAEVSILPSMVSNNCHNSFYKENAYHQVCKSDIHNPCLTNIVKDIVYNNFPWPTPTEQQKQKIEQTAQAVLDARSLYPDCSLADLYDELTMPPELRKAHHQNDIAVMQAYGFTKGSEAYKSEAACVAELMKRYEQLCTQQQNKKEQLI